MLIFRAYRTQPAQMRSGNWCAFGSKPRELHLMESPVLDQYLTQYPVDSSNQVDVLNYDGGDVWINATQYFQRVPDIAWNIFIGDYQPAQKWLKGPKGR